MSEIFGIGWAKTGTTTLGNCLELLGYDHRGQRFESARDKRSAQGLPFAH